MSVSSAERDTRASRESSFRGGAAARAARESADATAASRTSRIAVMAAKRTPESGWRIAAAGSGTDSARAERDRTQRS